MLEQQEPHHSPQGQGMVVVVVVVMVAVVDLPVSMGQFCLSKGGFTCLSCLVCSHTVNFCSSMSHANHAPIPHVFCGGTYHKVANQVS